ncbi:MAG: acylphosphatase [Fimbriimonadaceae bacterium]
MPSIRVVVTGRVQGVGFRAYAAAAALRHGLDGEAWNRPDGAVQIQLGACDETTLESFLEDLQKGPGIVRDLRWEACSTDVQPGFRVVSGGT